MLNLHGPTSRIIHIFEMVFVLLVLLSQYYKIFYIVGVVYFSVAFLVFLACGIYFLRSNHLFRMIYWAILICIFFLMRLFIEQVELWTMIEIARQYFGWMLFCAYFSLRLALFCHQRQGVKYTLINLRFIILVVVLMCIVELLFHDSSIFSMMRDGLQFDRVYGIVARPSSTAAILVCCSVTLFWCSKYFYGTIAPFDRYLLCVAFGGFLSIKSGVGVVLLFVAILTTRVMLEKRGRSLNATIKKSLSLILTAISVMTVLITATVIFDFQNHFSLKYLIFIANIKFKTIVEHIQFAMLLFGSSGYDFFAFGSDFSIAAMIGHIGLVGFSIFFWASFSNVNFLNFPAIAITMLSLFHYGAPFVSSGSIVYGIILSISAISLSPYDFKRTRNGDVNKERLPRKMQKEK